MDTRASAPSSCNDVRNSLLDCKKLGCRTISWGIRRPHVTRRLINLCFVIAALAGVVVFAPAGHGQGLANGPSQSGSLITNAVDDGNLVRLAGELRPEANAANDRGAVADDLPLPHMLLQLQRSPAQEQALHQLIDQLHNPAAPNFHHWLTPAEFGARFGVAEQDQQTIASWLQQHGFQVNFTYPNSTLIDFSGTAGEVREAFHTEIHRLSVNGKSHFANMSDPQIPAALAPAIVGIVGLHDFKPQRQYQPRPAYTVGNGEYLVAPADLATIYNTNPLLTSGISGQGQTIAVIEDTDVYSTADWSTFRSTFGLSGYTSGSLTQIHPAPVSGGNNCSDPGSNADDGEAILDTEWASAAAPSAAIDLVSCADPGGTGDGLIIALQNLINSASPPPIISISYGECESQNTDNASYNAAYQQAVAEGISVFVAAGDWGPAVCDASFDDGVVARDGIAVSGLASTPYNVAVGGTDFGDTYDGQQSTYWNASNTPTYGSARSYVPEIPWNNSCASTLIAGYVSGNATTYGSTGFCNNRTYTSQYPFLLSIVAGSGGPSTLYGKPGWQAGFAGIQNDGVRDLPDIALFAGNGVWGHYFVFCWSDTANGGASCGGAPSTWSGAGGTSFASPIMAGIQALVDQQNGGKQGNPDPVYYTMAAAEYGASGSSACNSTNGNAVSTSCVFYDITQGDNNVPCAGTNDCYRPSGTYGVLSTSDSSYQKAYGTTTGWDFATGIGSVNATNLVRNWKNILTVTVIGNGTVTDSLGLLSCSSGNCAQSYPHGAQISFNPSAASGWYFDGWSGACTGLNSCSITMNGSTSVTATFIQGQNVPVTVALSGSGTVTSSPPGINCGGGFSACSANFAIGEEIELISAPASGWTALGWNGACAGTLSTCVFTLNGPAAFTAYFGTTLTVSLSGDGTVTSSAPAIAGGQEIFCTQSHPFCSTAFPVGQQVTLTSTPGDSALSSPNGSGWIFDGWGGACSGDGNCTVTITGTDATVTAAFVLANNGVSSGSHNIWGYSCNDNSFDNLNGALAGTSPWSSTNNTVAAANGNKGQPAAGDLIEITNTCLGNITIATDDLVLTNHNDTTMSPLIEDLVSFSDGIAGQVEVASARNVVVRNLGLVSSNASSSNGANLYVHDGATLTAQHDFIQVATSGTGIEITGNAALSLIDSHVYMQSAQYAILADNGAVLWMGNSDGTEPSRIDGTFTGNPGLATIALKEHSAADIYSSSIAAFANNQIYAIGNSSVHLRGAQLPNPGIGANTVGPTVQVVGGSSLSVDTLANGTGTTINGSGGILLAGASSAILNSATLSSQSTQMPTIEASVNSSIILAGGNTVSNAASGGVAIEVDHTSALLQQSGSVLGYTDAPETISGAGSVLMQGSADLGQGPVSGAAGLVWNGTVSAQQNSSFRMQGGAHITGAVRLSQQSNGFVNCNNSGGIQTSSCGGAAGASNAVDGTIECIQYLSIPNNPSSHVSNPTLPTPNVTIADAFGIDSFVATTEPATSCLNF